MKLNAYLLFNGRCEEAFQFYHQVLGGKIEAMIRHAGSPAEAATPVEWRDKIMHARLNVEGAVLMGSDAPPDRYQQAKGFSVAINVEDPKEAERIFHGLAEGGNVGMPIQETFWAARFGMLVDRFGTPWMVNGGEFKTS
jgi:PhnB protein